MSGSLTPEAQAAVKQLGDLLTAGVIAQIGILRDDLARRVDNVRAELAGKLDHISEIQGEQAVALAKIETRLEEGDKRFVALEQRVALLEERERGGAVALAKLVGASLAGAASGIGITKLLGV
jgi:hypothetical protein